MEPNALTMEMATCIMNAYTNKTFGDNGTFSIIGHGFGVELWHCVDDSITAEIRTDALISVHVFDVDYISIETHPDLRLAIHGRGDISIPITLD